MQKITDKSLFRVLVIVLRILHRIKHFDTNPEWIATYKDLENVINETLKGFTADERRKYDLGL